MPQPIDYRPAMARAELRDAMEALGFGPAAFARALNVPYDTLKNWLNGRAPVPRIAERLVDIYLTNPQLAKSWSEKETT